MWAFGGDVKLGSAPLVAKWFVQKDGSAFKRLARSRRQGNSVASASGDHGPTVSVAVPETVPALAVIVVVPAAMAKAVPRLVASLLIWATVVFEELQITEASCCVPPPLKVPMA